MAYLGLHPFSHHRCALIIRESRLAGDPLIPLKYLGDHLALSLRTAQRREALERHYAKLPDMLRADSADQLRKGVLIWQKELPDGRPPLSIILEASKLAPMEGELQLRFSFRSDLFVLTFLLTSGQIFDIDCEDVLFIGGMQGRVGAREEMREACKSNGEISPATMLILAIQAIGKVMQVGELIAIDEDDQVSMGYSRPRISFDYRGFWTEAGGVRRGRHYAIPVETPQKPLSEITLSHRARTRRKREAKAFVRRTIENRLRQIFRPRVEIYAP